MCDWSVRWLGIVLNRSLQFLHILGSNSKEEGQGINPFQTFGHDSLEVPRVTSVSVQCQHSQCGSIRKKKAKSQRDKTHLLNITGI